MQRKMGSAARVILVFVISVTLLSWGFSDATSAAEKAKPILVGVPGSFASGTHALYGLWGTQLAVEEINAAGGVKVGGVKRPFKIISIDTRDNEAGVPISESLLAVEKLILDDKVDVLCGGPTMSEAGMAMLDLVAKHNVVHLTSMGVWTPAWGKKVAKRPKRYRKSFKASNNIAKVIPSGVDLLDSLKKQYGFDTAYIIIQDIMYCRAAAGAFEKIGGKRGWKILGKELIPLGTTDFSPQLLNAKKSGAKVLFYWWTEKTMNIFYRQFADLKVPAIPFGMTATQVEPEVWDAVNGKCAYFIFNAMDAAATSTKPPGAVKFQKAFQKKFKKPVSGLAASAYVGPYILKDAIERAGSLDTDALVAAMEKTDMMGVNGRIRFQKDHTCVKSNDPKEGVVPNWSQWLDGKRRCVGPPSIADTQVVLPPWMKKQ